MSATSQAAAPPTVRAQWGRPLAIAALALALVLPLVARGSAFYLDAIILVYLWAGLAGAWNIVGGYASQFSLGHAAFFGIGAYTSTLLFIHFGLSPWLGMLASGALAAAFAWLIGRLTIGLRGHFYALATLAFGEVVQIAATNWRALTRGSEGLLVPLRVGWESFLFEDKLWYGYVALAYLVLVLGASLYIERSRLGYYLVAYREDPDAARAIGIDTGRARLVAGAVSAFLTALGGTFYAQWILYIDPDSVAGLAISAQVAMIAIIGGLGTPLGPVVGAAIIMPLTQFLRAWLGGQFAGVNLTIYGVVLIVILLLMPRGVVGKVDELLRRQPPPLAEADR